MADLFTTLQRLVKQGGITKEARSRVDEIIALVNRNNPQWDDDEVDMYARAVYRVAPRLFSDPVLIESVLKKIMLYGGLDPALMKELADLNQKMVMGNHNNVKEALTLMGSSFADFSQSIDHL